MWRLRAVGRTFRYGVTTAIEEANGEVLTSPRGSRVYDVAQAQIPVPHQDDSPRLEEVEDYRPLSSDSDDEDEPYLDAVRHVLEIDIAGVVPQDVQVFRSGMDTPTGSLPVTPGTTLEELDTGAAGSSRGTEWGELEAPNKVHSSTELPLPKLWQLQSSIPPRLARSGLANLGRS